MRSLADITARLGALALLVAGAPLLDAASGSGLAQALLGFSLCVVAGFFVGRWWALVLPLAVLAAIALPRASQAGAGGDEVLAGMLVVALLGAFGATGSLLGVALRKLVRRQPVTA